MKSFRGENIGFTHFEGVYLPLIWEPSFCFKSPIALGYTRGHFTALVPLERNDVVTYTMSNSNVGAVSQLDNSEQNQQIFYLPLANNEGQLLPVHFLNSSEVQLFKKLIFLDVSYFNFVYFFIWKKGWTREVNFKTVFES